MMEANNKIATGPEKWPVCKRSGSTLRRSLIEVKRISNVKMATLDNDSLDVCLNSDATVNKALKGPYLLVDQEEFTQSDVEDHRGIQVRYSSENPSFVDYENNVVDEKCLREYRTFFRIP
ncbi:hypothetical protein LWI29_007433 [Acer saccharum]|uniref:Uncharacterized protein n=1 Tax=Acer saccharum TaxID=4024 RepID=A0AA39VNA8_ACESA|nr:hypothetical protein LWI29_007433 [Acer saccharum]